MLMTGHVDFGHAVIIACDELYWIFYHTQLSAEKTERILLNGQVFLCACKLSIDRYSIFGEKKEIDLHIYLQYTHTYIQSTNTHTHTLHRHIGQKLTGTIFLDFEKGHETQADFDVNKLFIYLLFGCITIALNVCISHVVHAHKHTQSFLFLFDMSMLTFCNLCSFFLFSP